MSLLSQWKQSGLGRPHRLAAHRLVALGLSAALLAACAGPPTPPPTATAPSPVVPEIVETGPTPLAIDREAFAAPPPRPEAATVIALLLPLSDPRDDVRELAAALFNAAQLALFDAGDTNLVLALHDTGGTEAGAANAVQAALAGNAELIIGPLFSTSVRAVSPYLQGRDVAALAFSNNTDVAGDNVWLLGFLPEDNIERIVMASIAQGLTRFAALVPEGQYGARTLDALKLRIDRYGGTLVDTRSYPPDAKEMFEPVRQLARFERRQQAHAAEMERLRQQARQLAPPGTPDDRLFTALGDRAPELVSAFETLKLSETLGEIPYDVVFMPEGGLNLRNLAPLLPYFDIDPRLVKFIGTGLWDDPSLAKEPPLHGGWYAAPEADKYDVFASRYRQIFGGPPPRLAGLAYDGVSLAAMLRQINPEAPFDTNLLTDPNGFAGVDGILRLTENGRNERGLAVLEITAGKARTVSPAPRSFVDHDRRLNAAMALAESLQHQQGAPHEQPDEQPEDTGADSAAPAPPLSEAAPTGPAPSPAAIQQ